MIVSFRCIDFRLATVKSTLSNLPESSTEWHPRMYSHRTTNSKMRMCGYEGVAMGKLGINSAEEICGCNRQNAEVQIFDILTDDGCGRQGQLRMTTTAAYEDSGGG